VRGIVDAHEGSVIKSQGDGFMVAFESAHSAVHCAIDLQRTFAERTGPDRTSKLRVRIGAHSGSMVRDMDDFYGRNVVLAARIAESANGGEILVSSELKEYTENDPSFDYVEKGTLTFKGLSGEHDVYGVPW
jgi:adenylate cyclase